MMFVQKKTDQPGWMISLQVVDACNEFEFSYFSQCTYISMQQFSTASYHFQHPAKNTNYRVISSGPAGYIFITEEIQNRVDAAENSLIESINITNRIGRSPGGRFANESSKWIGSQQKSK